MLSKVLEQKVEVTEFEDSLEAPSPMVLEYYLLESELSDVEELTGKRVYGIGIVKNINSVSVEEKVFEDITCCKTDIKELLNKLARNIVTPVCLEFVLDDIIGISLT